MVKTHFIYTEKNLGYKTASGTQPEAVSSHAPMAKAHHSPRYSSTNWVQFFTPRITVVTAGFARMNLRDDIVIVVPSFET